MSLNKNVIETKSLTLFEREIDLKEISLYLWNEKKIISIIIFFTFLIGCFLCLIKTPQYKSDILIEVANKNTTPHNLNSLLSNNMSTQQSDVEAALIQSRFIIDPVILELGLHLKKNESVRKVANDLIKNISIIDLGKVHELDKTGILQVSLTGTNPEEIVTILNTIANILLKKGIVQKHEDSEKTLQFLEKQVPIVKMALSDAETKLNQHKARSGMVDFNLKSQLLIKEMMDLHKIIQTIHLDRINLLQKYTPSHPYLIAMENRREHLELRLKQLETEFKQLPLANQETLSLLRDIKVKSSLYLLLLNKVQELKIMKTENLSDIRILSYAQFPAALLPMHRLSILMSSILIGFMIASLCVLLKKYFIDGINDPYWLEHEYGIPTLAYVLRNEKYRTISSYALLANTDSLDKSIESLRNLHVSLETSLQSTKNNLIAISGISHQVGKSFVAANFAYLLSNTGKRILLIDGDLRNGNLHQYFKLENKNGLSDLLTHQTEVSHLIKKTHLSHLDMIPRGQLADNPSELLMHHELKNFLEEIRLQYDIVIMSTSPILNISDGIMIARLCGINYLVLSKGKHQKESLRLAVKSYQDVNIPLTGIIFNDFLDKKTIYQSTPRINQQYILNEEKS